MDLELYFLKEVVDKYKVDKILKPFSLGNGELQNVSLSHLRKELDFCYYEISHSITFKEKLLDYLEDYLVDLRAFRISEQKGIIKKLKQKVINVENEPIEDDNLIGELNIINWKIDQEKYILHYLKEQKCFIRDWVSEKRQEDKDIFLKNFFNKIKKKELVNELKNNNKYIPIKNHDWYNLIEPLVSGKISKIQELANKEINKVELAKRVVNELNVKLPQKSVEPYMYFTYIAPKPNNKNLYSQKKVEEIFKYCNENKIEIVDEHFLRMMKKYFI